MVGTTKISISINKELKNAIDILADGEDVSRAKLIESILINNKSMARIINAEKVDTASGVYAVPSKIK